MLILHNEPKFLAPVPVWQWREPSQAQPKDMFGRSNRTRFVMRGWSANFEVVHEQWYDDRAEFDRDLWHRIIDEPYSEVFWRWAVVSTLTSPTGSNQTWNRPVDWNNSDNNIQAIGAGGRGGRSSAGFIVHVSGGGGGAWAQRVNYTASASETYQIASSVAAVTAQNSQTQGVAGGDSWFGATTFASSTVGAKGGSGGVAATLQAVANGGAGGASGSCIGSSAFSGGRGGNKTSTAAGAGGGSGGGGAGGPNGIGANGVDSSAGGTVSTNGGQGDNGTGGTGGAGSITASAGAGNPGTEITGSEGAGGGGGGCYRAISGSPVPVSGAGGNYGGASGGSITASTTINSTASASAQGIIIVTYVPAGQPFGHRGGGIPGMSRLKASFGGGAW